MGEQKKTQPIVRRRRRSKSKCIASILLGLLVVTGAVLSLFWEDSPLTLLSLSSSPGLKGSEGADNSKFVYSEAFLPSELYDLGLYKQTDFVNEIGISPPYWKPKPHDASGRTWGPCFPERGQVDWHDDRNETEYTYIHDPNDKKWVGPKTKAGLCRPGFLIIGAGKCGTSSLYHYLLGHPRVAPAYSKQIHYFIVSALCVK